MPVLPAVASEPPVQTACPAVEARAWAFAAAVLALLLLWFGAMGLLPFSADLLVQRAGLSPASARGVASLLGVVQLALGLGLLPVWPDRVRGRIALAVAAFWWLQMLALASPAMWVDAVPYDGFPFLGAGQGLLKHLGLGALGFGLWAHWNGRATGRRWALRGLWAGQLLVLVWIGLLKFTAYEARGVEGLMRNSPLFAWLYEGLDVQGASNLIGVVELATAALIALWLWRPRWAVPGLAMAVATYALTTGFLFSTPAWAPGHGFPYVAGSGQFLLKDLGLLAGALVLLAAAGRTGTRA
ncbi:DUF417 family protein [Marilutibacter aestuarii]|uniref:DUF417 family protein n=1 Tax=Marilutibacter aestuarii TaxID=1706195 RepID=A0A508ANR2_9GAMM|nr:DUF417 family protein [Lysobacter aestuarii]TQD51399.1 DUF417 family protein [Lysobacter aestuarii]